MRLGRLGSGALAPHMARQPQPDASAPEVNLIQNSLRSTLSGGTSPVPGQPLLPVNGPASSSSQAASAYTVMTPESALVSQLGSNTTVTLSACGKDTWCVASAPEA